MSCFLIKYLCFCHFYSSYLLGVWEPLFVAEAPLNPARRAPFGTLPGDPLLKILPTPGRVRQLVGYNAKFYIDLFGLEMFSLNAN